MFVLGLGEDVVHLVNGPLDLLRLGEPNDDGVNFRFGQGETERFFADKSC